MSDLVAPARFLFWIVSVVVALGLLGSLGKMTYTMAETAIEAHQKDQMSYGKFSRLLWSQKSQKQPQNAH